LRADTASIPAAAHQQDRRVAERAARLVRGFARVHAAVDEALPPPLDVRVNFLAQLIVAPPARQPGSNAPTVLP
jgi:hypothetical protein